MAKMFVIQKISEYKKHYTKHLKSSRVGFVPTMGYLHEGHMSLVRESIKENDFTVVSIFVNPKQFGQKEDLASYPRDLNKDLALLEKEGVNLVFNPEVADVYPEENQLSIQILPEFTNKLCGKYRESHFEGVALVVLKLVNIIEPDIVYFGQKDYQQFQLIQKMTGEFNLNFQLKAMPIVREKSGLAMSSRNSYLSEENRLIASFIQKGLVWIKDQLLGGTLNIVDIPISYETYLISKSNQLKLQYIEVYDRNLNEIMNIQLGNSFMATAVFIDKVRLIDNILF